MKKHIIISSMLVLPLMACSNSVEKATAESPLANFDKPLSLCVNIKDTKEKTTCVKNLAQADDISAQAFLGAAYKTGSYGLPKDSKQSLYWRKKALDNYISLAKQGDAYAQIDLGDMYYLGLDIEKNQEQGLSWYHKAIPTIKSLADKGNDSAQGALATLYIYGKGLAKDTQKGEELLLKSAKHNNLSAEDHMMITSLNERDLVKAYAWNSIAMLNGLNTGFTDIIERNLSDDQKAQGEKLKNDLLKIIKKNNIKPH